MADAVVVLVDDDGGRDHEGDGHENAGNDAGYEQAGNGYAAGGAVKDQRNRRGNENAQAAGGRVDRRGKAVGISFLDHGGDHDAAHGRDGRRRGTAQGTVKQRGQNGNVNQSASQVSDQAAAHAKQGVGKGSPLHDIAGQQEEGNGHKGEGVKGIVELLGEKHDGRSIRNDAGERAQAERDAYRGADNQQSDENNKKNEDRHILTPL